MMNNTNTSVNLSQYSLRTAETVKKILKVLGPIIILTIFWAFLIYDLFDFFRNNQWLSNYLNQQNRIITLLALFHGAFFVLRTCLTVSIVLWKCDNIRRHRLHLQAVYGAFGISKSVLVRTKKWLALLCLFLNFIIWTRTALGIVVLLNSKFWVELPWGAIRLPHWVLFVIYAIGNVFGGFMFTSVVILTLSMTIGLVLLCRKLNFLLQELLHVNGETAYSNNLGHTSEFLEQLYNCRTLQEQLYNVVNQHEKIFNMYFFVVLVSINLTLFSTLATLFRPEVSALALTNCLLSCFIDCVLILLLVLLPAQVSEENQRSAELAQKLLYRLQIGCRTQYTLLHKTDTQVAKIIAMQFLQRPILTPLVLTIGVCVNLGRGFLVTWCCILCGFIGFLIEKSAEFEGDKTIAPHYNNSLCNST